MPARARGRTYVEIATELGLSVSAVETLIFRARRTLREQLEAAISCEDFALLLDDPDARSRIRAHARICPECPTLERQARGRESALKPIASMLGLPMWGTTLAAIGLTAAALVGADAPAHGLLFHHHRTQPKVSTTPAVAPRPVVAPKQTVSGTRTHHPAPGTRAGAPLTAPPAPAPAAPPAVHVPTVTTPDGHRPDAAGRNARRHRAGGHCHGPCGDGEHPGRSRGSDCVDPGRNPESKPPVKPCKFRAGVVSLSLDVPSSRREPRPPAGSRHSPKRPARAAGGGPLLLDVCRRSGRG